MTLQTDSPANTHLEQSNSASFDTDMLLKQRGSHDFLSLPLFVTKASSTSLMRAQQNELLSTFSEIQSALSNSDNINAETVLKSRNLLTMLSFKMTLHLSLEDSFILKTLPKDQRGSALLNQFERETNAVKSSFQNLLRNYPTPSSILKDSQSFIEEIQKIENTLSDLFKVKNRELYQVVSGQ